MVATTATVAGPTIAEPIGPPNIPPTIKPETPPTNTLACSLSLRRCLLSSRVSFSLLTFLSLSSHSRWPLLHGLLTLLVNGLSIVVSEDTDTEFGILLEAEDVSVEIAIVAAILSFTVEGNEPFAGKSSWRSLSFSFVSKKSRCWF